MSTILNTNTRKFIAYVVVLTAILLLSVTYNLLPSIRGNNNNLWIDIIIVLFLILLSFSLLYIIYLISSKNFFDEIGSKYYKLIIANCIIIIPFIAAYFTLRNNPNYYQNGKWVNQKVADVLFYSIALLGAIPLTIFIYMNSNARYY